MWILPKQLHTCHSVQVMTESESDLKEFYQTCEQSLMWRSKLSQSQTWFRRWKTNSWMQHLSTRMLRPSHTKSFLEKYLSYQEDSLVSPLAKLELEKELKTLATSIPTSVEESKNVNQELFSSKMLKELSQAKQQKENQFSTMCLKTWKDWVTKQRQEYSLRVKSASLIREKESSLWGTPTLDSTTERAKKYSQGGKPLTLAVKEVSEKNWSTPTTGRADQQMSPSQLKRNSLNLAQQAEVNEKNWSTPTVIDSANIQKPRKKNPSRGQKPPLCQEAMNFPTPRTSDAEGGTVQAKISETGQFYRENKKGEKWSVKLKDAVETFPTPMARDYKDTPGMTPKDNYPTLPRVVQSWGTPTEQMSRAANFDRGKHNIGEQVHGMYNQSQDQTNNNTNGKSLVLNPSWVEQLMGLTVGWTDCDFSEME